MKDRNTRCVRVICLFNNWNALTTIPVSQLQIQLAEVIVNNALCKLNHGNYVNRYCKFVAFAISIPFSLHHLVLSYPMLHTFLKKMSYTAISNQYSNCAWSNSSLISRHQNLKTSVISRRQNVLEKLLPTWIEIIKEECCHLQKFFKNEKLRKYFIYTKF